MIVRDRFTDVVETQNMGISWIIAATHHEQVTENLQLTLSKDAFSSIPRQ